jgi:hypothetical protein
MYLRGKHNMNSKLDPGYIDCLSIEKQLEYIVVRELLKEKGKSSVTIPELFVILDSKGYVQRFSRKKGRSSFRSRLEQVFQILRAKNIFTASKKIVPLGEDSDIRAKKYKYSRKELYCYYRDDLIRNLAYQLNLETDSMNLDGTVNGTYTPSDKLVLTNDELEELAKEVWKILELYGEI